MRQFVNNQEDFPPFTDDMGRQCTGPGTASGSGFWPAGWLIFEILPGGKQHVTGEEWNALVPGGGANIDSRVGWLDYWSTGRIQGMPNIVHVVQPPAPPTPTPKSIQIDSVGVMGIIGPFGRARTSAGGGDRVADL